MNINSLSPLSFIFLQAKKDNNNTEITQRGLQEEKDLTSQYGSSKKVVVFGDHAVALDQQTFSELETKFGKAKTLEKGGVVFNKEGSNFIANWYDTITVNLGYAAADKNHDGIISDDESNSVKTTIVFDSTGNVFLDTPLAGEEHASGSINHMVEKAIRDDKDKDGTITTSELKEREGIDIDALRKDYMSLRGQNPDGTPILPTREDLQQTPLGMDAIGTPKKKHAPGDLKHRLQDIETQIEALHKQHVADDDPKLKALSAARQEMLDQLKQSGARSIDVKA